MADILATKAANLSIDMDTAAQIINGDATLSAIPLRLGGTARSLQNAAASMAKGDKGDPGDVSSVQLAGAITSSRVAINRFDPRLAQTHNIVRTDNGAVSSQPANSGVFYNMSVSGLVKVEASTSYYFSDGLYNNQTGLAWHDASGNVISIVSGPLAPGLVQSPVGAVTVQFTFVTANAGSLMFAASTVSPVAYSPLRVDNDSNLGRIFPVFKKNLFDATTITQHAIVRTDNGDVLTQPSNSGNFYLMSASALIAVKSGVSYYFNQGLYNNQTGLVWRDAAGNVLSIIAGRTDGSSDIVSVYTAPAGAVYAQFTLFTDQAPTTVFAEVKEAAPLQGKKGVIFGDSYTQAWGSRWLSKLASETGSSLSYYALAGRPIRSAFADFPSDSNGTTLAKLTAALAGVDFVMVQLGTNDGTNANATMGTQGDTSFGTVYGDAWAVLDTLFQANPNLFVMWVGSIVYDPSRYNGGLGLTPALLDNVNAAITYACRRFGVPFLKMSDVSGFNSRNWDTHGSSVATTRDGVHPSDTGFANMWEPLVRKFLVANYNGIKG
jgi:lysophospholipase L1-like esterase